MDGNEIIYYLTSNGSHELRVELEDFESIRTYAHYMPFAVGDQSTKYRLNVSNYFGTADDGLAYHNGCGFTTRYNDNHSARTNCALYYEGAWWYYACINSNLNVRYLEGQTSQYGKGVIWFFLVVIS
ncbi:Ryncolin-2 [Mizuhopecten yessoensis]|uniref:Ryncolin-2 n=1 Tax=Mizuhopecten yessoensis TaxID=6573 RepID=A0A210QHF1_MIZYE|nr:Ryncolin-2 [Mizuhopecten yessoensis]